jgi:hypothetical protein
VLGMVVLCIFCEVRFGRGLFSLAFLVALVFGYQWHLREFVHWRFMSGRLECGVVWCGIYSGFESCRRRGGCVSHANCRVTTSKVVGAINPMR